MGSANSQPTIAAKLKLNTPIQVSSTRAPDVAATFLSARTGQATGRIRSAFSNNQAGGSVLSTYEMSFQNGDHKLRQMSVLQSDGASEFAFADQDSNDPFNAAATWYQSTSFLPAEVLAQGGGEFEIALPNRPAGYTPVLRGFSFRRSDGTDANVRMVEVRINPTTNKVRVALVDDQGTDFRKFGESLAIGFGMSALPFGVIAASHYSTAQAALAYIPNDNVGGFRRFEAKVQISWVPESMILDRGSLSGSSKKADSGKRPGANSKTALQGFLFTFTNSDHHLLQNLVFITSGRTDNVVSYQDGDGNDPMQWYLDWVSVK